MRDLEKVQKTLSDVFDYLNGNNLQLVGKELLTDVGDAHRIVENLAIHGVVNCVYVITYNDDYGRPIYDNCFLQKEIAEDYVKDHDYLRMDNTTVIREVEFE